MSTRASGVVEPFGAVSLGQKLAGSEAFKSLFKEGMYLVELSAAYLDGPGRLEAKALPRAVSKPRGLAPSPQRTGRLSFIGSSARANASATSGRSWLSTMSSENERGEPASEPVTSVARTALLKGETMALSIQPASNPASTRPKADKIDARDLLIGATAR